MSNSGVNLNDKGMLYHTFGLRHVVGKKSDLAVAIYKQRTDASQADCDKQHSLMLLSCNRRVLS